MLEFNPETIIHVRRELGLDQSRLADKAGISRLTLARAEKGHSINVRTFIQILNALGMDDPRPFFRVPILFRRFSYVKENKHSCQQNKPQSETRHEV